MSSQDGQQKWLYDLADDPTEQTNLAAIRLDKLKELEALLAEYQANARAPLYPAVTGMPVMIDKTLVETYREGDEYVVTPN